jgi:hypothetical protein
MGNYLSAPVTVKESAKGENDKLKFGLSAMQGWRLFMVRAGASNGVSAFLSRFGPAPRVGHLMGHSTMVQRMNS